MPKKDSKQFIEICEKFMINIADSISTTEDEAFQTKDFLDQKIDKNIYDLPLEIILKVLSYLSTSDLLLNVACVSKSFNKLTTNPGVHRQDIHNIYFLFNKILILFKS
jgi:hypothetical protein